MRKIRGGVNLFAVGTHGMLKQFPSVNIEVHPAASRQDLSPCPATASTANLAPQILTSTPNLFTPLRAVTRTTWRARARSRWRRTAS